MADLNGKECNGNALRFALAKPKESNEGPVLEDTKPLGAFLDEDNVDRAVKLRGLPFKTTVESILSFVKENSEGFSYLTEKDVVQEVKEGKATGFALLFLKNDEDAEKALDLDHKEIGSRWVGVSAAEMRS
jgi:RNA recognition motif-containing protein